MRRLDQTVSQDVKKDRDDDQYTEISMKYNKDSRRNQYDNHKNRENNLASQYQQSNHEHYQHIRNIKISTIFNLK